MRGCLIIVWHLGCGDAVICNAIVRDRAKTWPLVVLPVKYRNVPSIQFMFKDLENVLIRPVEDDEDQLQFAKNVWKGEMLKLGVYGGKDFDWNNWDRDFYRQAQMPFEQRWNDWKCQRDPITELGTNDDRPYRFVHDDPSRGMNIEVQVRAYDPLRWIRPDKNTTTHIFQYWHLIEHAEDIHCISSCFALFIDSIPLPKNPKLYLHAYARGGEALPAFRKVWNIIK